MKSNYWVDFWKDHGLKTAAENPQLQVLRTLDKKPIDDERWEFTLAHIEGQVNPSLDDKILDLCCGNGLLARKFSETAKSVTAVDVSDRLVSAIGEIENITPIVSDVRALQFEASIFDKVVLYAGLQYFSHQDVIEIFERVFFWLRNGGIFYIGDIPDQERIWTFFDDQDRETAYFDSVKCGKPIIGTWFDKGFLEKLSDYVGFSERQILPQPKQLIYSSYRFDLIVKK